MRKSFYFLLLLTVSLLFGCGGGGGGASAPNDFSVPTGLTLSADYPTLAAGTGTLTTTTGHYAAAPDEDLTGSVVLSSSNSTIASIAGSTIIANTPGTADITATWSNTNGDVVTTSMTMTVTNATATAVTVSPSAPDSLDPGATQQFTATASFDDGSSQVLFHAHVDWASDDETIATINTSSGVATAVEYGDATISATFGGVSGTAVLSVNAELASISISASPAHIILVEGETASTQLTVTGIYTDGTTRNITESAPAIFSSDAPVQTLVISNQEGSRGLITGITSDNLVVITATVGQLTATYDLAILVQ